jgi:pSer/pThr/pTyr-binding forkhead associated (FHA) protein
MPELIVKLGDSVVHKYFFDKEVLSIGRAKDNDIVIENLSVSRNHARIRRADNKYILTDLNSANGTYVNNIRVNKTDICHDDVITIGKHTIHFVSVDLSDEQIISDAFGAERTMIVDKTPVARLVITKGKQQGQEFKITKTETYIGRSSDNDIRLHDWFVSKKHAMILRQGQNFFIKDLKSWRGTMVNGKFTREAPLHEGDAIQFGSTTMSFHIASEEDVQRITGRVPQEFIEHEEEPEKVLEEKEAFVGEEEEFEAKEEEEEELQKMAMAEEAEVAGMQSAWEPLQEEESQEDFEAQAAPAVQLQEELFEQEIKIDKASEPQMSPEPMEEEEAKAEPIPEEEIPRKKTPRQAVKELPPRLDPKEVELWLKALANPSKIIRKNAAQFLKKLTGKDYDYE